jgi:hypothetical protein
MMNVEGASTTSIATATIDDAVAWSHGELAMRARRTRWAGRFSAAAPLVGIAAGAWLALGPRRRAVGLGALGASIGLGLVRWQLQRWVTEQAPYELQATLGEIELRSYPDQIHAETTVEGMSWERALSEGFERLAGYIFGGNQRSTDSSGAEKSANGAGENLSMTAPVFASVVGSDGRESQEYTVSFVMPIDRSLAELPAPLDSRIRLREVPARIVAVLPFRGNYKTALPREKSEELLSRLYGAGLPTRGDVWFAGYDPPSTLPALRRNEVLVELEPG